MLPVVAAVGFVLLLVVIGLADNMCCCWSSMLATRIVGLHSLNAVLRSSSSFQSAMWVQEKILVFCLAACAVHDDTACRACG